MPYIYAVVSAANLATNATPNTETVNMALRQATRGFDLQAIYLQGKGAALTAISGIIMRVRRWTTAGSGGTSLTPSPRRRDQPAAATTAVDNSGGAITAGTVSGAYQLAVGCGAAGPGGWVAANPDSKINVEGGSADELDFNSASGTASLNFEPTLEIEE